MTVATAPTGSRFDPAHLAALAERHGRTHPHVVVASLPKSGSTWLNALLVAATGFRPYLLNTAGGGTERDIDPLCVPMLLTAPTVGQEHMRATRGTVRTLRRLGVRPVVLVRDLFDLVVSAVDHAEREPGHGPAAHVPPSFATWPRARRVDFVVRCGVPWLLTLYASWCDAAGAIDVRWLRYEDLVRDPAAAAGAVLEHAGVPVAGPALRRAVRAVDGTATRRHRGVIGRGRAEMTADQVETVQAIAAPFARFCDLRRIGLS